MNKLFDNSLRKKELIYRQEEQSILQNINFKNVENILRDLNCTLLNEYQLRKIACNLFEQAYSSKALKFKELFAIS